MFEDFQWDHPLPTKGMNFHIVIGKVEFSPNLSFIVMRHRDHSLDPKHKPQEDRYFYSVTYRVSTISGQITRGFETREKVERYLTTQMHLAPEYDKLVAKQKKLRERMTPLAKKMNAISDQLFSMVKP